MKLVRKIFIVCAIILFNSCGNDNSYKEKGLNPKTNSFRSQKNDSLKVEVSLDKVKNTLHICVTNLAEKDITISSYSKWNLSSYPEPGFVIYVYEEKGGSYSEMISDTDYDTMAEGHDSLATRIIHSHEKKCELNFLLDRFFTFHSGKNYRFFARYCLEYLNGNHNKYIESNTIEVKW